MTRSVRCPCGKRLQVVGPVAGRSVTCPSCKRTLKLTGAAGTEAGPRRWPWLAGVAAIALLAAGGGVWYYVTHRPAAAGPGRAEETGTGGRGTGEERRKPELASLPGDTDFAGSGGDLGPAAPASGFALSVDQERTEVSPTSQVPLKVRVRRGGDFAGPVVLTLEGTGLPSWAAPTLGIVAPGDDAVTVPLTAAAGAKPGPETYALRVVGRAADGDQAAEAPFALKVVPPFEVKAGPAVTLAQGGKATVQVTVTRQGGYAGPVTLEWRGLPAGVTAKKTELAAGDRTAAVEFSAADDAAVRTSPDVLAVGRLPAAAGPEVTSAKVAVTVTAAATKPPFDIRLEPTPVKLTQGGKATVKATVVRRDYAGPIDVELRNLPARVDAPKRRIPAGQNTAEIELTAAADAVVGDRTDVAAVGTPVDGGKALTSDAVVLQVASAAPLFDLRLEPAALRLPQGGKARLRVTVERKDYQGPITLDLRNLPARTEATRAVIDRGKNTVEVEVNAAADAAVADKNDVTVLATAPEADNRRVESSRFTLSVQAGTAFELKAAGPYRLRAGERVTVRVTAVRHGYEGPIAVELRGLPGMVTASRGGIAAGRDGVDLELTADARAERGERTDVRAVGTAAALGNKEVTSPPFLVGVQPAGTFALTLAAPVVIRRGTKVAVKVVAARQEYDGPIHVELQGLPGQVTASKATIDRGQSVVEVDVTAQAGAALGDKNDVRVVGTAPGTGIKDVTSPTFTVSVHGMPFEIKVDPTTVMVRQGGKVKFKVIAVRDHFDGPITADVHNLPEHVTAHKVVIPKGANTAEIEVSAEAKAAVAQKGDVRVRGTADNQHADSPPLKVVVEKK